MSCLCANILAHISGGIFIIGFRDPGLYFLSSFRVQLSPGAARNGGSHLASAVGMDQTAS